MASLNMDGIYEFNSETIDKVISKTSPGNYALGHLGKNNNLVPEYIGRSDDDLNTRIKQHLNDSKYTHFKFSYASSSKAAFEKECKNYHDFIKQLDNEIHPDRPDNSDWECPKCNNFD